MRFLKPGASQTVAPLDSGDVLAQSLGLWLPMTERGGTLTFDATGRGGIGTLQTGAVWTASGARGAAITISGSGYISVPSSAFNGPILGLTLAMWINATSYTSYNGLIAKTTSGFPNPFDWYFFNAGPATIFLGNGATYGTVSATNTMPLGRWCHVAVTAQFSAGNNWAIAHYLDGLPNGAGTTNVPVTNGSTTLRVGSRDDGATQIVGAVSDARISSRPFTPSEIWMVYQGGLRPWLDRPKRIANVPVATYAPRVIRWSA